MQQINNNYHDLVNREEIAKAVDHRNGEWKNDFPNHPFVDKTVDEAVAYWEARGQSGAVIERILRVYEENSDLLASDRDLTFIRELLTHPERGRLRLIHDGSYYTHRIWFHIDTNDCLTVDTSICWKDYEFKQMSKRLGEMPPREQVDFLFKNFEVVYIQTPVIGDRVNLKSWIRDERWDRESGWVDWDDVD